jgi:hypothetical protein
VILSTSPGEQAALIAGDGGFVATLQPSGVMRITDTSSGQVLLSVGPFSNCKGPLRLVLLATGQLVIRDKSGAIPWASTSACRGNSSCYT